MTPLTSQAPSGSAGDAERPPEVLYRGLFDHALVEVHIWRVVRDEEGDIQTWRLVDANQRALQAWGDRKLDELIGLTADEIFPEGGAVQTFSPIVREIFATGRAKEWEVRFPKTNQVLRMVSYPAGEFFVSTGFDISPLRRKESELADALEGLQHAVDAGGVGLWDWNLVSNSTSFSDEWKRQIGYGPDELENDFESWRSRVHPGDIEDALAAIHTALQPGGGSYEASFRLRHKDGSYRWILAQAKVVTVDGRAVRMVGSHLDITERKQLEQKLIEAQKIDALGTLAAGIAHDFNNLLTTLKGNLSLMETMSLDDELAREMLGEAQIATEKAASLTGQLLTFSKGGAPVRELASLRELIAHSARFASRGGKSEINVHLDEDLATAEVDAGQISQVMSNLIINAEQAMPSGGRIEVTAKNAHLGLKNRHGLVPGPFVQISVADEGPGIEPDVLGRIFDPFFSTKAKGSGLGLSTSFSIVGRHGGRIYAESIPGHGATFHVLLPASFEPVSETSTPRIVRGSGRILVMDDDAELRRMMKRLLELVGYECDLCQDADEAVETFVEGRQSGRSHDAVILDLTIPGKAGGTEVLARLKAIDPSVRAIVASGYAEDEVLAEHLRHGFAGRLRKPMDAVSVSSELARVLGNET